MTFARDLGTADTVANATALSPAPNRREFGAIDEAGRSRVVMNTESDEVPLFVTSDHRSDPGKKEGHRRTRLLAYGVLAAAAFVLVATYIPDQPTLSPYDEWVYVDYVDKMTRLDIPQQGELIDTYALEIASCRGVFVWGTIGSPCGGPYESLAYPLQGVTSADIHPPTYFGATAGLAEAMRGVGLFDDLLTSARAVGALAVSGFICDLSARS